MEDIEIAKKVLIEEGLTLAVVKDNKVIFRSMDKGIKPMYILATEMKAESRGASIADKVIGKGAAMLCGYIGIKEVYTELISNGGIDTLEKCNISYIMKKSCAYIKNRDRTDYCPIEKLSLDKEDPILLLQGIKEFLASISRG